jgi:alkylation response protein AidB-like acyl-CoA dehydrogenase
VVNAPEPVAEFDEWLADNWDPDLTLRQWRQHLVESGWGRPSWPVAWFGRGLPVAMDALVEARLRERGAVGVAFAPASLLAGPTLLEHGSDDLKGRLLLPLLTGVDTWCQLFSEPNAGSDLAALQTRAVRSGDRWIINGQKVWSSSANHAQRGMLLARTGPAGSRQDGITFFAVDMRQPGIEVRPIHQMNGHASFNEVFFSDVVVDHADVVGEVGGGWSVARTTLAHERRLAPVKRVAKNDAAGRVVDEARGEAREALAPYTWYPQRSGRPDLLISAAKTSGRNEDAVVRQEIMKVYCLMRSAEWTAARAHANRKAGRPPGPEGSLGKLYGSALARSASAAHVLIAGPSALIAGERSDGRYDLIAEILTSVPAASIAGGTDEIQRNIVGERILGLPREPSVVAT